MIRTLAAVITLITSAVFAGESAIGQVRVVVNKLKAAGYLQVTVAGSLAKPNAKCKQLPKP